VFEWVQKLFTGIKNTGFLQGVFTALGGAIRVVVDLARIAWSGLSQLFNLLADTKLGKIIEKLWGFAKGFGKSFVEQADKMADEYSPPGKAATPTTPAAPRVRTKADRNNPGDLRYAGQAGATNEGGFASFKTLAEGIAASNKQLNLFAARGINTIDQIISKWAPPNENNTAAYKAYIAKVVGKGVNEQLTSADRQKLLQGIFNEEGVNKVGSGQIASVLGNPNALAAAKFANNQATPGQSGGGAGNNSTTTIDIDQINVHAPNARNANDIAAELPGALRRKGIVAQADSGMS
jgi:hypothetical protein